MRYGFTFTSESGDNYEGGYWASKPNPEDVHAVIARCLPCEWEYIEELIEDGSWSEEFYFITEVPPPSEELSVWNVQIGYKKQQNQLFASILASNSKDIATKIFEYCRASAPSGQQVLSGGTLKLQRHGLQQKRVIVSIHHKKHLKYFQQVKEK